MKTWIERAASSRVKEERKAQRHPTYALVVMADGRRGYTTYGRALQWARKGTCELITASDTVPFGVVKL